MGTWNLSLQQLYALQDRTWNTVIDSPTTPVRPKLVVPTTITENPQLVAYIISYLPLHKIDGIHEQNIIQCSHPEVHKHWNEVCYMAFQHHLVLP